MATNKIAAILNSKFKTWFFTAEPGRKKRTNNQQLLRKKFIAEI